MNTHLILLHHPRSAEWFGYQFKEYYTYAPDTRSLMHNLVIDYAPGEPPQNVVTKPCQLVTFLHSLLIAEKALQLYTTVDRTEEAGLDWRWLKQIHRLPDNLRAETVACMTLMRHCEEVLARELLYVEMETKAIRSSRILPYDEIQRNAQEREQCRQDILHQLEHLHTNWIALLTHERIVSC